MNLTVLGVGVTAGIALGCVYALVGIGFTLVIGATRLFVFAFESVVSLGGIVAYELAIFQKWPVPLAGLAACAVGAIAGIALEVVVRRPFVRRARNVELAVLVTAIGISIFADAVLSQKFGANPRLAPPYVSTKPFFIGSVPVQWSYVVVSIALLVIAVGVHVAMRRTRLGHQLSVLQQDSEGAELLGLRVGRLTSAVFGLAGLFSALAGFLVGPILAVSGTTGSTLMIPTFTALAVGGYGSVGGAITGGLLVGLVEGIVPLYLTVDAVNPILLGLVTLVLVLRPSGLFGRPELLREF